MRLDPGWKPTGDWQASVVNKSWSRQGWGNVSAEECRRPICSCGGIRLRLQSFSLPNEMKPDDLRKMRKISVWRPFDSLLIHTRHLGLINLTLAAGELLSCLPTYRVVISPQQNVVVDADYGELSFNDHFGDIQKAYQSPCYGRSDLSVDLRHHRLIAGKP